MAHSSCNDHVFKSTPSIHQTQQGRRQMLFLGVPFHSSKAESNTREYTRACIDVTTTTTTAKDNTTSVAISRTTMATGVRRSWARLARARWCRTACRTRRSAAPPAASPRRPWRCSGPPPPSDPGPSSGCAAFERASSPFAWGEAEGGGGELASASSFRRLHELCMPLPSIHNRVEAAV